MDTKKTLTMAKEHEPCSGYDQKARSEILRGCELTKRLEEHLKEAPLRSLDEASNHDLCLAFLRSSSLEIAEAFRNASVLLQSQLIGSAEQLQVNLHGYLTKDSSPTRKRSARGKISIKTESLISPTRTRATSTLSPRSAPSSAAAGPSIPSPQMSSSDESESSPAKSSLPEPDSGDSAASSRVRKIQNEAAEGCEEQANAAVRDNSRKRKVLPKLTIKLPSMDEGEGPPNDGFTWRKYGQKVIIGTRHPRCYYRCTHKYDVGCPAKKQVQKTDDNPNIFNVTYQGFHSCLPHTLSSGFCFPPLSIPSLNIQQLQSIHSNCSAAIQLNPSPHLLLPFSSQYSPLHFPSSYLSPDQAPRTFMQPSPTSSYSLQPFTTDLGTAEFEPASTINLDANTSDSFSFEVACCTTADTSATTSQNSSPARNCNTPVLTEAINFEPLTATLGREPQIYDTSMHPSTKDNASADFLPHFLLPLGANLQEAGRSFQGAPLLEQSLASQREATQEEGIMVFPPFLDEFSYMEEEILGIDDLSNGRAAL